MLIVISETPRASRASSLSFFFFHRWINQTRDISPHDILYSLVSFFVMADNNPEAEENGDVPGPLPPALPSQRVLYSTQTG